MPTAPRLLRALTALTVGGLVIVGYLVDRGTDVLWPGTLLAFAPRWIWGAPLLVIAPWAALRERRLLIPIAIGALILLFPILDLRVPVRRLARLGSPRDLRIMTYNVGGGHIPRAAMEALVREVAPDIFAAQEREGPIHFDGMNNDCTRELCLSSRFWIQRHTERDRSDLLAQHGSGAMARYELQTPLGRVDVINVHLATIRPALADARAAPARAGAILAESSRERGLESEAARAFADAGAARRIVVGDFNIPVESAIYRRAWGGYDNAFSTAGFGFGATKHTRWHGVRIDHVLVAPGWEIVNAFVGPGIGGDHRPVIADLRWTSGSAP